jgi:hypothetical protein
MFLIQKKPGDLYSSCSYYYFQSSFLVVSTLNAIVLSKKQSDGPPKVFLLHQIFLPKTTAPTGVVMSNTIQGIGEFK